MNIGEVVGDGNEGKEMTSVFEHGLITEGWRSREAKRKKDRKASSWISPDGKWYNIPFCDHQMFAYYVIKDLYPEHKDVSFDKAGDVLVKNGWILIQSTWATGTILRGWKKMTPKQYKVLYATFGNEPLFRGWTIALLYRESKGE